MQIVDLRSINKGPVYSLDSAHGDPIRDMDFNPNRQYYMVSCGDDGFTKFWDIRNLTVPVLNRQDHYHWYRIGSILHVIPDLTLLSAPPQGLASTL